MGSSGAETDGVVVPAVEGNYACGGNSIGSCIGYYRTCDGDDVGGNDGDEEFTGIDKNADNSICSFLKQLVTGATFHIYFFQRYILSDVSKKLVSIPKHLESGAPLTSSRVTMQTMTHSTVAKKYPGVRT
uniref:Uncharacterized protein n=1 Tax=Octopus bimaculoides TaxID=37653 RepID=A0A0L8H0J2_OCTBM